jgi:LAS superfamily LD-carboxypeptidase LdcB
VRVIALTLVLAFGAVGCLPPDGQPPQNGRLPDNALTEVTPQCRVANDVATPLRRMLYAARVEGVALWPESQSYTAPLPGPPRDESCYRSYEMQVWWRDFYCFFGNCDLAAVPGTSVHGWGRAVDFEDGGGELTFGSSGYAWLQGHAAAFGFVHPAWAEPGQSSAEPWHWEFAG